MRKNESELAQKPWFCVARALHTQTPYLTLLLLGIHHQESSTAIQKSVSIKMFQAA